MRYQNSIDDNLYAFRRALRKCANSKINSKITSQVDQYTFVAMRIQYDFFFTYLFNWQ